MKSEDAGSISSLRNLSDVTRSVLNRASLPPEQFLKLTTLFAEQKGIYGRVYSVKTDAHKAVKTVVNLRKKDEPHRGPDHVRFEFLQTRTSSTLNLSGLNPVGS